MIGIDTNVLVRYILQDDYKQSALATYLVEQECSPDTPAFINGTVLCELVWVLESAYEYPKTSIVKVIDQILRTRQFYIHEPEILWQSLRGYAQDGADFADHYIAALNYYQGCEYTVTFDKRASRVSHFTLLKSKAEVYE